MTHSAIARCLLALLCGTQGVATLAIDLNRSHASNPHWPGHARFHLVWQVISYALLSLVEVALILVAGAYREQRFYLAAILAGIPMLSCQFAFVGRRMYGGAVYNPDGIQPIRISFFGSELTIDLNLTSEVVALLMLLAIVALFRH